MVQHLEYDTNGTTKTISASTLNKDGSIEESPIQVVDKSESQGRLYMGEDFNLVSNIDPDAIFGMRHVVPIKAWKLGDEVKAGEIFGYASLGNKENNFDMDYSGRTYKLEGDQGIELLDSMFDHMTDSVLAELSKYGLTPENTKFTKAQREAEPCGYDPETKYNSTVCEKSAKSSDPTDNACFVKLIK
jgi:hypothetical protein